MCYILKYICTHRWRVLRTNREPSRASNPIWKPTWIQKACCPTPTVRRCSSCTSRSVPCSYHVITNWYRVYTEQKWSRSRDGTLSRRCTWTSSGSLPVLFGTFIVQYNKAPHIVVHCSLLHRNPPNIWVKIIQIAIQIECLLVRNTWFRLPDITRWCLRGPHAGNNIYVYIDVCMCIHACIGTYICIDIRMDVRVWMYVYTCVSYSIFYLLIVSVLWNLIFWTADGDLIVLVYMEQNFSIQIAPCKRGVTLRSDTPFTWSKNDVDRDLYRNLDCDLDCNPDDILVYTKSVKLTVHKQNAMWLWHDSKQ